jgi:hypothetical protein
MGQKQCGCAPNSTNFGTRWISKVDQVLSEQKQRAQLWHGRWKVEGPAATSRCSTLRTAAATAMLASLLVTLAATATAAEPPVFPGSVPVFYGGLNGSKCYRIPTIIKTSKGTLLAFSENRVTDCGDNGPHHALVLRRSSDDGATWGPMSTVVEGTTPCPGCPAAISNPNPVSERVPMMQHDVSLQIPIFVDNPPCRHPSLQGTHCGYATQLTRCAYMASWR